MAIPTIGFLKKLLDTPGPSGFEQAPARVWRDEVSTFADDMRADVHGNSVAVLNPKGKPRVMFAGHIDEIGFQITHIDEDGFLYFAGIGGWGLPGLFPRPRLVPPPPGTHRRGFRQKTSHHA